MKFEHENEQVLETVEQSEGVLHKRVDEEEPPAVKEAVLPVEEAEEITDLFGEPVDKPQPVKLPPAKKPAPKAPAKKEEPKEEEKYGPEYQYAYAGHVGNLPHEDMTLNEVREFLNVDFPELSKERTRMDVDKEAKLIVPLVTGAKRG